MIFEDVLTVLGERLGVDLCSVDGVCSVEIDDMAVSIREIDAIGGFCFLGEIGKLPDSYEREAVMSALLTANHLFKGTGGATISLDPDTGGIFLCLYERLDLLDGDRVLEIFNRFIDALEVWRDTIANYNK